MSHEHRDEHQLTDREPVDVTPPVPVVPPVPVSNSETARRAEERRKAEGIAEQTTNYQFTGELPRPSRGDGTETELGHTPGEQEDDDGSDARTAAAARRGPPAPRFVQHEDESTWASPLGLSGLGGSSTATTPTWARVATTQPTVLPRATATWIA